MPELFHTTDMPETNVRAYDEAEDALCTLYPPMLDREGDDLGNFLQIDAYYRAYGE